MLWFNHCIHHDFFKEKETLILNKKPLYEILDENYKNTIEKDILQEKKEKLAKIRDLHKPINIEEIKEHEKRYD